MVVSAVLMGIANALRTGQDLPVKKVFSTTNTYNSNTITIAIIVPSCLPA